MTTVEPPVALESADLSVESPSVAAVAHVADQLIRDVEVLVRSCRRPTATYRVQFNHHFTFTRATQLVSYWHDLGISDLYASPYLKAVPGSMHGYDIVDHSRLNPEVGTDDEFRSLAAALNRHAMGQILDFVPNHMGVASDENAWWQDVLENGPGSRYASYFDIDWNPPKPDLQNKVLLPVLGEQFGQVLESGQLQLEFHDGAFTVRYMDRRFPISPTSFALILQHRREQLAATMPPDDPHFLEYQSILTALTYLPSPTEMDPAKRDERAREKQVVKRRLQRLCEESPPLCNWILDNVRLMNGQVGDPHSFDLLERLLDEQAYRLSFWQVAADEINYRRFFDVNELAAVCMERPEVFESAHALVFQLMESGLISGLRIDHADGLYDPTAYLWQLQESRFLQLCRSEFERRIGLDQDGETAGSNGVVTVLQWPDVETELKSRFAATRDADPRAAILFPLYLVVEKILERNERMPANWPIHGSTGYDFVNDVNGLFIASGNAQAFDAIYSRIVETRTNFAEMVYDAKRLILRASMSSELHVLGHALERLSERNRRTRDFTLHGLIQALREVIACFPVYRTYTVGGGVLERDRRYVEQAVGRAKRRNPDISDAVFDFVRNVLLMQGGESLTAEELDERQGFIGRFQQLTGPMMAKAVEDTTYYRFNRLVSMNEVGGDPERFGLGVDEFHQHNQERQAQRPFGLLATSTHDTKRSEDVRARINILSELPTEWKRRVSKWGRWNKRKKTKHDGDLVPVRNDEYLLYQTLVGTWPFEPPHGQDLEAYIDRIQKYMVKAVREAKAYTSWIAPNEAYEQALSSFIQAVLSDDSAFRTDFEPFARQIADWGQWNSLSQSLLKLASPGVPDIYQGTELWNFSLVDPDNRRPVDYELRRRCLDEMLADPSNQPVLAERLVSSTKDGRIKLYIHQVVLGLRRQFPDLFTVGEYLPVPSTGPCADHVCAFVRQTDHAAALVVVPRLIATLTGDDHAAPVGNSVWQDTAITLPAPLVSRNWTNAFTGEVLPPRTDSTLALGDLLRSFPVGLLMAEPVQHS